MIKRIRRYIRRELTKEFLTWRRLRWQLRSMPRYQKATVSFWGNSWEILDAPSFLAAFKIIFLDKAYQLPPGKQVNRIIDCGANIGLSILFFKLFFPESEIVAFEADPAVAKTLRRNIDVNNLKHVEIVEAAAWVGKGFISFAAEGADAGRIDETARDAIQVPTVRLREFLNKRVSLLKLDIEGAELSVLKDCSDVLQNVETLVIESHSFASSPQTLDEILNIYRSSGFRYYIFEEQPKFCPALGVPTYKGMDQYLLVHGMRPENISFLES